MTETPYPDGTSGAPWPGGDHRVRMPDASMPPDSEAAPTPAVDLLNEAVQGAHDTLDHLAQRAAPVARQRGEGVAAADDAARAKTDGLRETRIEWADQAEALREKVRRKPLASLAVAFVLGVVIARITR